MIATATRTVAIGDSDTADYFGSNTAPPMEGRLEVGAWRSLVVTAYCTNDAGVIIPGPTFSVTVKLIRIWNLQPDLAQKYNPISALNYDDIVLRDRVDNIISEQAPPALGWVFPQILAAAENPPGGATQLCIRLAYEKDV
jgi:hypothetical protein